MSSSWGKRIRKDMTNLEILYNFCGQSCLCCCFLCCHCLCCRCLCHCCSCHCLCLRLQQQKHTFRLLLRRCHCCCLRCHYDILYNKNLLSAFFFVTIILASNFSLLLTLLPPIIPANVQDDWDYYRDNDGVFDGNEKDFDEEEEDNINDLMP